MNLSIFLFITLVLLVALLHVGLSRVTDLKAIEPSSLASTPSVSIIVAARNEQKGIEKALRSLLALEYDNKEIIVVNDRSTDATPSLLEGVRKQHPLLKIIHIETLPPGWLGKNHAHYMGAKEAKGDIFLFTDADIVMEPTTLKRALTYLEDKRIDHLAIGPGVITPSWLLATVMVGFQYFFNVVTRPWKVRDPHSFAYVGIGAFNMIRRSAYEKMGTHQTIAMRPDDDMRIGYHVKRQKCKSDILFGVDFLKVEWYGSLKEMIHGLMKNSFSGANYHISLVVLGTLLVLLFFVWPFMGIFFSTGMAQFLYLVGSLFLVVSVAVNARRFQMNLWLAPAFPLTMLLLLYIIWKASLRTIIRGGIEWRGTFYSLKELKKG